MMITVAEWLTVAAFFVAGIWQFFWMVILDSQIQKWDEKDQAALDAALRGDPNGEV